MSLEALRSIRVVTWGAGLCLSLLGSTVQAQEPRTQPEMSAYTEETSYDAMMSYLGQVQGSSPEMRLGVFGETHEGRELPYAIFSRPSITTPWEARVLDKPILLLAAGVHGDEPTLRESLLILLREFATSGTEMNATLDDLTVLVVPQLNPDGFSTSANGQRGNARGIDLNRDYMKLEQPEIRSLVRNLLLPWAPDVFVDGHNGGSFPYNLNYQCPSHPAPDPRITRLCDDQIFPAVDQALEAEGFRSWYYQTGDAGRWDVGGPDPRIARNYLGLANIVGILFESPSDQNMTEGIRSGILAYGAVVRWAAGNTSLLKETVRAARLETLELGSTPVGEVPIELEYAPEEESVTYLIPDPSRTQGYREVQSDSLMKRPLVTHARARPWAYLLPRDAEEAVALVRAHGVQVETLAEGVRLDVEAYTVADITYEAAYNHQAATRVEVLETVRREVSFAPGTFVVRTGQLQGRVAAHLLEAETRDGVVYWNRMDALLPKAQVEEFKAGLGEAPIFPILKLTEPAPLPTRLIE